VSYPPSGSTDPESTATSISDYNLLEYVEIDVTRCQLTYGAAPCAAAVGVTGEFKCYNSPATCQDPANYSAGTKTFRFAKPTADLPVNIDARPNLQNIRIRAQEVKPAESLGTRESVTVSFQNHRDSDAGYDPYLSSRSFNPYTRGTHWGKFIARWPNLQGYALRVIRGALGQSISEMEARHYYIESTTGPDIQGKFSITAKDALKFLDGKKAQAPVASSGRLATAITATDTSLTLEPAGIGDLEYPASGNASIGDEYVSFTRSGDTVSLTGRGLKGSEQDAHDEGETFQIALVYASQDPADIIDDLIFNYTDTAATYRDLAAWQSETTNFYGRLLSADIAKPTPVKDLVSELIQQVGLLIYTDIVSEKIRLKVLRQGTPTLAVTDDNHIAGSLKFIQDEEQRINAIYTYYGQKNPLENLDEDKNYKSIVAQYDDDQVKALENLPLSIRKIRSRWITNNNRPAAEQINDSTIERYGDTPGMCSLRLPFNKPVSLGSPITLKSRLFEDSQGSERAAQSAIVTSIERSEAAYNLKAQLFKFRPSASAPGSGERTILIDENVFNLNLRETHDLIYTAPSSGDVVSVFVSSGTLVGSDTGGVPAFDVGDWPTGVTINITVNGRIQGMGGQGAGYLKNTELGETIETSNPAGNGELAFYTRYPVNIDNQGGIWGGGGGGGVSGSSEPSATASGGGGAGYQAGSGGGTATTTSGGSGTGTNGATGHAGGDPGQAGVNGNIEAGGAAGNAIDGNSHITFTNTGDIRGAQVN
jgi:hypothetical protein